MDDDNAKNGGGRSMNGPAKTKPNCNVRIRSYPAQHCDPENPQIARGILETHHTELQLIVVLLVQLLARLEYRVINAPNKNTLRVARDAIELTSAKSNPGVSHEAAPEEFHSAPSEHQAITTQTT